MRAPMYGIEPMICSSLPFPRLCGLPAQRFLVLLLSCLFLLESVCCNSPSLGQSVTARDSASTHSRFSPFQCWVTLAPPRLLSPLFCFAIGGTISSVDFSPPIVPKGGEENIIWFLLPLFTQLARKDQCLHTTIVIASASSTSSPYSPS